MSQNGLEEHRAVKPGVGGCGGARSDVRNRSALLPPTVYLSSTAMASDAARPLLALKVMRVSVCVCDDSICIYS
jgi:hypothetical protein